MFSLHAVACVWRVHHQPRHGHPFLNCMAAATSAVGQYACWYCIGGVLLCTPSPREEATRISLSASRKMALYFGFAPRAAPSACPRLRCMFFFSNCSCSSCSSSSSLPPAFPARRGALCPPPPIQGYLEPPQRRSRAQPVRRVGDAARRGVHCLRESHQRRHLRQHRTHALL